MPERVEVGFLIVERPRGKVFIFLYFNTAVGVSDKFYTSTWTIDEYAEIELAIDVELFFSQERVWREGFNFQSEEFFYRLVRFLLGVGDDDTASLTATTGGDLGF